MVSIKKTDTNNRISVKSTKESNVFGIKDNLSEYYAKQSENWAHSDVMVNGIDYSSKYYAEQSKASAQIVSEIKSETQALVDGFDNKAQIAQADLEQSKVDSANYLNDVYNNITLEFQEKTTQASEEIETKATEAIGNLEETIETSIAEYTEISNQIKQENSEASKLAQDWAISEVIVENLDYSAKYWAGKAKDNSGIFYDELTDEDIDVEILDINYATKSDLELGLDTKQDKGDYATRTELSAGLDTKQAKGNYALKSDIPNISNLATKDELPTQVSELENDSNYATQTQVMQAIASIPQFSLSIVNELPLAGGKMTLYLVPKEGTDNDVYDEYIWIEQTESFEHLGTTAVDLTDYVKNTDYATSTKAGIVKVQQMFGLQATANSGIFGVVNTLDNYDAMKEHGIVCKGTLDNVLTQYSKTVLTTEADYNALETKDANTLYLIEE